MEMLEDIIRSPIFYQLSVFGLQISVLLFEFELVNSIVLGETRLFSERLDLCARDSNFPEETRFFPRRHDFSRSDLKLENFYHFQNVSSISIDVTYDLAALIAFSTINYTACFFTSSTTSNMMSMCELVYDLNWFQLSRHEQFIVQTIIQRSQRQFELKGLGILICSLETYLKVRG